MSVTNSTTSELMEVTTLTTLFEDSPLNGTTTTNPMSQILDPQADNFLGFWLLAVCGTGIGLMGIFGNICSVRVLSHRQMRSSPNFILIALAMSDLMLIITFLLLMGWSSIYPYTGAMKDYFYRYQPVMATVAYPIATIGENTKIKF